MATGKCWYIYIFSIDWVMVWYLLRGDSRPHWDLCGIVQELNFLREREDLRRGLYTIKVVKHRDFAILEY